MNKLLRIIGLMGIVGTLASVAFAQTPGPGGQAGQGGKGGKLGQGGKGQGARMGGMKKMQDEIFAKIGVSAAQKTKIEALNKKFQAEMQAMMKTSDANGANRDKFRAASKKHREAVMAVLTKAQQAAYQKERQAARAKFGNKPGLDRGPAKGAKPGGGKPAGSTGGGG